MSIWAEAWGALTALFSGDAYEMKAAFSTRGSWLFFFFVALFGGLLVNWIYKKIPWLEKNLERGIMTYSYIFIALIIFWGVIDRFVFSNQVPWSTTIPPMLFMIMTWFACCYDIRQRSHLSFMEFRAKMSRPLQFMMLTIDAVLWFGFGWIVITTSARATVNSAANFQIILGTDNIMQWWFIITVPIAFTLMVARAIGNYQEDVANYKSGDPLIKQIVIGGDA